MKLAKKTFCQILPIMQDNYVPLLRNNDNKLTAVVDPGTSGQIFAKLEAESWALTHIFLTHHHGDHIGGVQELVEKTGAKVIGHRLDAYRLPPLDVELEEGDSYDWGGVEFKVMFLPGHTLGHIAYYVPQMSSLFCGDVLFAMGCGRLFEGTPEQMQQSLSRIAQLPKETMIYCAHEYTEKNGEFALQHDSANESLLNRMEKVKQLRSQNIPTVPFTLAEDLATNPFLRAKGLEEFTALREARNQF